MLKVPSAHTFNIFHGIVGLLYCIEYLETKGLIICRPFAEVDGPCNDNQRCLEQDYFEKVCVFSFSDIKCRVI